MVWYSHEYARAFGAGIHVTPDEWDIDHPGEPSTLLARLNTSIPGKNMRVLCSGTVVLVEIETTDFTGEELTTVTNDIATQKAVVDWPWTTADICPCSVFQEDFGKAPAADATQLLAGVSANGNSAPGLQPNYPSNVNCVLTGSSGSTNIVVTITGKLTNGRDGTEVIDVEGADATVPGVKAFLTISDIAYTGTWDSGTITFKNGALLGLCDKKINSVFKETFDGVHQATGTFNSTNKTYEPTGTLDGVKKLELWLEPEGFNA